jgi:hypothetical protein
LAVPLKSSAFLPPTVLVPVVGLAVLLAVACLLFPLLSLHCDTSPPLSVMLAASLASNHNAGVAISSGDDTAVTAPASVVKSESVEDASSQRARPEMERGVKAVSRGLNSRGLMLMA